MIEIGSPEPEISRIAASTAAMAARCNRLIDAPETTPADAQLLSAMVDHVIEVVAGFTGLVRGLAGMWADPAVLEATIRLRLTPGQVAELSARLEA